MTRGLLTRRPAALALALVALVFGVDLCLPLGVASAVPYTFAVLLALRAKPGRVGPAVAVLCMALTLAKMGLAPERGGTEMWKVVANRCLALFAIGMTTLLGVLRRRAEAQVRQQEAVLARMSRVAVAGELATVLAHELNQPLAAVCLQADLAVHLAPADAPEDLRAALGEVAEQSRRAAEIVRSIRRAVRPTAPERGPIDLNQVARDVVRLLDWRARRAGAAVSVTLAPDPLPAIHGDRVQLEQVLVNLLQNAFEAVETVSGPRLVSVSTIKTGAAVEVRVSDTGPGLSAPDQAFERFYTTKPDGMGLGLAISRSAVRTHGGELTAAARAGGGAEFVCVLPISGEGPK
ncbi:MAG TPA: ATP-binding protein [Gemmata sp.]